MLGDLVREHRRRLGLSQEELASRTGISARGIRKIESRQTDTARPATVRLLADAFGLRGVERDDFCRVALGATARPPAADTARLDFICEVASAQSRSGNVPGARATRDQAVRAARGLGDPALLARAYTAYDPGALWTLRAGAPVDATVLAEMTAVLDALPSGDSVLRGRLLAGLALEAGSDDPARVDWASAEALAIARRLNDPELLCRALSARCRYVAGLTPDRWAELDPLAREQLVLAGAAGLPAYQACAHHVLGTVQLTRHDLRMAAWHLDEAGGHATPGQLGPLDRTRGLFDALRLLIAGRVDEAERAYGGLLPEAGRARLRALLAVEHAREVPGTSVDAFHALFERLGEDAAEAFTWVLLRAGQTCAARAVWKPHVPLSLNDHWSFWTVVRAENALRMEDSVTAARCYRQLLPWAGHVPGLLGGEVALAPVDHTLGDLASALHRPAAAVRHYADATVVADRLGAPLWAARSRQAAGPRDEEIGRARGAS
ncbi:helix-turn-helix domain-containing protein [Cryptosporangium sp. NPDC051539]|uniref:helix-turn-helix domain-containing protein n=1 Tax=Cryptosporangium sp. NPDC051539 TaxID=3363962 RepID=UPI0037A9931D